MHILSDVIKRWVSRFFSDDSKAQRLAKRRVVLDAQLTAEKKRRAEDSLRRNGFVKGVNGTWVEKPHLSQEDWWKPQI